MRPSPSRSKPAARDTAAALLAWLNALELPTRRPPARSLAELADGAILAEVLSSMFVPHPVAVRAAR